MWVFLIGREDPGELGAAVSSLKSCDALLLMYASKAKTEQNKAFLGSAVKDEGEGWSPFSVSGQHEGCGGRADRREASVHGSGCSLGEIGFGDCAESH